ncbi:branched-chain amino acid ABC transporter permease [Candidatus Wolfebacteria bacterium]|nr:branched-chain amino acid ABC transporter permease [Candidatus Wolfebacteria bacterium]
MEYLINLGILVAIYGILGLSLNLVVGYSGLLSVTHAAFYGIGAYATALLMVSFGVNFFIAMVAGMTIAALTALLIGIVLSKFRNDFYALASLGFNVIIFSILLNWESVTRGPLGIPGIPRPTIGVSSWELGFSSNLSFLILSALLLIAVYYISKFIVHSSFGRVLKALREDEETIQVFGYNTRYYKLGIFVIAAALAAVAGSLFATYITFIDPSTFTVNESIFILAIIILGGLASLRGAIVGALFLILLPEALRFVGFPTDIAAQMRQVVYGVILILLMLYRPQGLFGEYKL